MAKKPPVHPEADVPDPNDVFTDIGTEGDDVIDATDQQDDDQQDDSGDDDPQYGLQRVETGVATRNTGLQVSHRAMALNTDPDDTGGRPGPNEPTGSEPILKNKAYKVTKAQVKDRVLKASYDETLHYEGMAGVVRHFEMAGGLDVHPDLQRCFVKLTPFFGHVLEQSMATPYILEDGQSLPETWGNLVVTKVAIKDGGVVITGFRKLKGNRQTTLNTPFIDYNTDRDSWYRYADLVEQLIEDLKSEVVLALEGKAFSPQLNMFDAQQPKAA